MRTGFLILLLAALAFASSIQLVVNRHEARSLFVQLQTLRAEEAEINREWGQLLLEQATWGTQGRVETIAREQLSMITYHRVPGRHQ
ncbi:MAG: cell division protein FtsL [Pseudomonadota bacterium]